MTSSRYLILIITISLTCFLLVGGVNYLINPFDIMNVERINGLNKIKPEAADRIITSKRYQPIYFQPDLLLIGNSRIEMGIDPDHPSFKPYGKVYNLGTPGIGIPEQLYVAQRVVESQDIKTIIISLDFADFLKRPNSKFQKREYRTRATYDKFAALWSLDALLASFSTIVNQNEFSSNRLENGFNPARDYIQIILYEGQKILFEQMKRALLKRFAGKHWRAEEAYQHEYSEFLTVVRQVNLWQSSQIEVIAFISPYHQEYYEAIDESQLSEDFLNWRVTLKDALSKTIKFCDFTDLGYEKSNEKLNDKELKYFWEPAHYKKELGDIMIPELLKGC